MLKKLVPIEKQVKRIGKKGEKNKNLPDKLKFINSVKFIANSLSDLVDNLAEEIHKIKCQYGHSNTNLWSAWN